MFAKVNISYNLFVESEVKNDFTSSSETSKPGKKDTPFNIS
jgi:hypothetical protein